MNALTGALCACPLLVQASAAFVAVLVTYFMRRQERNCLALATSLLTILAPLLITILLAVDVYAVCVA